MQIPLINEHLFCKYFVRLSVGNATKGFFTYGCFHPCFYLNQLCTLLFMNHTIFKPKHPCIQVYIVCAIYLALLSAVAIPLNLTFVLIFATTKKVHINIILEIGLSRIPSYFFNRISDRITGYCDGKQKCCHKSFNYN